MVALASVKRTAFVERPNQSNASGSTATPGSGFMIAVSSVSASSPTFVSVATTVKSTAIDAPIPTPSRRIRSDCHVAPASDPSRHPSQNAWAVSSGEAKSRSFWPNSLHDAYAAHAPTKTASSNR